MQLCVSVDHISFFVFAFVSMFGSFLFYANSNFDINEEKCDEIEGMEY